MEYSGALYHITSRGNEREPIFKNKKYYYNICISLFSLNIKE